MVELFWDGRMSLRGDADFDARNRFADHHPGHHMYKETAQYHHAGTTLLATTVWHNPDMIENTLEAAAQRSVQKR